MSIGDMTIEEVGRRNDPDDNLRSYCVGINLCDRYSNGESERKMPEEEVTDYKSLYEQVVGEYEKLLEKNMSSKDDSPLDYLSWDGIALLLQNKYFVWGVVFGCILLLIIIVIYGD